MGRAAHIGWSWWLAVASLALAAAPTAADAQAPASPPTEAVTEIDPIDIPPEDDPLAHAWDRPGERGGFYLRLSTTLGVNTTRLGAAPWEGDGAHAGGFGTAFGADVGGFVAPWLALHLDTTVGALWNGDLDYELAVSGIDDDLEARVLAYGAAPAATFYTPHSFFLKTAFGVGFATVQSEGASDTSNPGFYMDLVAGKDLYVDTHFSFGIQMQVIYMLVNGLKAVPGVTASDDEARVRQIMFGFSASFDSL